MAERFDAYHRWLGIPPSEQPPDHYRLLGLQLFEDDPEVIQSAADQRMAHLRNYQTGEHSDLSQRLLNEVAAAKVGLLNAGKKAAYDRQLRAGLEAGSAGPPPPGPGRVFAVRRASSAGVEPPSIDTSAMAATRDRKGHRKLSWQAPAAITAGSLLVVVLLIALVGRDGDEGPRVARHEPSPPDAESAPPGGPRGSNPDAGPTTGPRPDGAKHPPGPDEVGLPDEGAAVASVDGTSPSPPGADDAVPDRPEPPADSSQAEPEPPDTSPPQPPDVGPVDPVEHPPAEPPRLPPAPVPSDAAQQEAWKLIRDVLGAEYDAAKTLTQKQALAKKLLQQATESAGRPAVHFVLLREARDVATEGADGQTAFQAIEQMAGAFQIDARAMKAVALDKFVKMARMPEQYQSIMEQAAGLIEQAVAADEYETATRLGEVVLTAARALKAAALARRVSARLKEIETFAAAYAGLSESRAKLQQAPSDPDANLALGRYYCLTKGDWAKGLPMLKLGSDPALQRLAQADLEAADAAVGQLAAAEGWWELAEEQEGPVGEEVRLRAGYWYTRAGPNLAGLEKAAVEKKLDSIFEPPSYALGFDGATAYAVFPLLSYDGSHPITIEAVVMPGLNNRVQRLFCNMHAGGLGLGNDGGGKWQFFLREGRRWRSALSAAPAAVNEWVHLAGVFDGHNVVLFVNGRLQPTRATVAGKHTPCRFPFCLAANPEPRGRHVELFCGLVDEIRVSNSAKYTRSFKPSRRLSNDGDTILLLHFDEGSGAVAHDSSASKYHGTNVGAKWVDLRRGRWLGILR